MDTWFTSLSSHQVSLVECFASSIPIAASSSFSHALRYVSGELALQRLGCAGAPTLGDRLRHGIGEDVLVAFLQTVEDAARDGLRRKLRYVEVSRHVGVHGAGEDGMNLYALSSPESPQRLCQRQRRCLRDRIGRSEWHARQGRQG